MASTSTERNIEEHERVKRDMDEKVRIKEQLQEKKNKALKVLIDDDFEKAKELVDECIDLKQQLGEVEAQIKAGRNRELKKKIDANKQRTDEEK